MKIKFNHQFYKKEAIEEAINDFRTLCDGRILNMEITVEIIPKENIKNLEEEFSNYVLGLMKNKILV